MRDGKDEHRDQAGMNEFFQDVIIGVVVEESSYEGENDKSNGDNMNNPCSVKQGAITHGLRE